MAYVIAEPRIGTKNTTRVEACPVDCIHLNVLGSLGTPAAAMARPPQKVPMRRHLRPLKRSGEQIARAAAGERSKDKRNGVSRAWGRRVTRRPCPTTVRTGPDTAVRVGCAHPSKPKRVDVVVGKAPRKGFGRVRYQGAASAASCVVGEAERNSRRQQGHSAVWDGARVRTP